MNCYTIRPSSGGGPPSYTEQELLACLRTASRCCPLLSLARPAAQGAAHEAPVLRAALLHGERSGTACGSSPLGSPGQVTCCPVVGAGGAQGSRGPPQQQESTATIKQLLFPPFHIFLVLSEQDFSVGELAHQGSFPFFFWCRSYLQMLILSSLETCMPSASSWLDSIRAHVVFLVTRRLFWRLSHICRLKLSSVRLS